MEGNIIKWYKENKRNFIWRENPTPYKIMIAEFMLQRTKAEQVAKVYTDFLNEFPDIYSIIYSKREKIDNYIKHLGLMNRVEYFINAAKYINEYYSGKYPETREELLKIPGVGEYVSGVILTVCFNKKEYVIDSNIARFINRYFGFKLTGEIRRKKEIIEKAKELFNVDNSGEFLFMILDFCFYVCKYRNPVCVNCVLKNECRYFNQHYKYMEE